VEAFPTFWRNPPSPSSTLKMEATSSSKTLDLSRRLHVVTS
jgi:hypothetical protein